MSQVEVGQPEVRHLHLAFTSGVYSGAQEKESVHRIMVYSRHVETPRELMPRPAVGAVPCRQHVGVVTHAQPHTALTVSLRTFRRSPADLSTAVSEKAVTVETEPEMITLVVIVNKSGRRFAAFQPDACLNLIPVSARSGEQRRAFGWRNALRHEPQRILPDVETLAYIMLTARLSYEIRRRGNLLSCRRGQRYGALLQPQPSVFQFQFTQKRLSAQRLVTVLVCVENHEQAAVLGVNH